MIEDYFANESTDNIASVLSQKFGDYINYLRSSGYMDLIKRSHKQYFKGIYHLGREPQGGLAGEYTILHDNHFRNILQNQLSLTVNQRPAFEPKAANTDYKSIVQVKLASGLLDYYLRDKKLERNIRHAAEEALWSSEAFVKATWGPHLGKEYGVGDNNQIVREGDISYNNSNVLSVARDVYARSWDDCSWCIERSFMNKYELAGMFPDQADAILSVSYDPKNYLDDNLMIAESYVDSDQIPVYEFYHKDNAARPGGRYTFYAGEDVLLFDGPMPYRELPLYRISYSDRYGTSLGYTVAFDLLPLQKALDVITSIIETIIEVYGLPSVDVPMGSNITPERGMEGLKIFMTDRSKGKVEVINLLDLRGELFKARDMIIQDMETISGVNATVRGNPESSLKSGSALALVATQAIQFSQNFQQAYTQLLEDLGTATINLLKDFATSPRVAMIAGLSNSVYMQEFTGNDLSEINRVLVDMGNPLARTTAGRINLAESLIANGMIQTPEQYIQVLTTGRLEVAIEGTQAELLLIRAENEAIMRGEDVDAIITDLHAVHIREHKVLLASPQSRKNAQLVQATLSHIQEHIDLMKSANKDILVMTGSQPLPPDQPQPAEQMQPGAAPLFDASNPVIQEAQKVNNPKMPQNPVTGQPYSPPTTSANVPTAGGL